MKKLKILSVFLVILVNTNAQVTKLLRVNIKMSCTDEVSKNHLSNSIKAIKGVVNLDGKCFADSAAYLRIIYNAKLIKAEGIESFIKKSGYLILDGIVEELSHCKADCSHKCCTYPDKITRKCLCFQKKMDCSKTCCGGQ